MQTCKAELQLDPARESPHSPRPLELIKTAPSIQTVWQSEANISKAKKKKKKNTSSGNGWLASAAAAAAAPNLHSCACVRKINGDVSGRSVWLNALLNATRVHRRVNQEDIDGTSFRGEISSPSLQGARRPHGFISRERERSFLTHPAAGCVRKRMRNGDFPKLH